MMSCWKRNVGRARASEEDTKKDIRKKRINEKNGERIHVCLIDSVTQKKGSPY